VLTNIGHLALQACEVPAVKEKNVHSVKDGNTNQRGAKESHSVSRWGGRSANGKITIVKLAPHIEVPFLEPNVIPQFDRDLGRFGNLCGIHTSVIDVLTFGPGCPAQSGPSLFSQHCSTSRRHHPDYIVHHGNRPLLQLVAICERMAEVQTFGARRIGNEFEATSRACTYKPFTC
jgi:hypothetical protein